MGQIRAGGALKHVEVDRTAKPRDELMGQIRAGGALKHVEVDRTVKPTEGRDGILDQIRSGVALKKVSLEQPAARGSSEGGGGIAGMLQKALQERSGALRFSSSEDEGSETAAEDDDEWDD